MCVCMFGCLCAGFVSAPVCLCVCGGWSVCLCLFGMFCLFVRLLCVLSACLFVGEFA